MKAFIFLLILQLIDLPLFAQNLNENNVTTHTLELLSHESNQPVSTDITIFENNSTKNISVHFPDDTITTEYIMVEKTHIKFQLCQIKNQKLLTIQFIGTGDLHKEINGNFAALVEGEFRKDMSGTIKIIKTVKK